MPRRIFRVLLLCIVFLASIPLVSAQNQRCFSETNQCITGRFLEYWEQNGGLPVFGYPITPARDERNADTGQTYWTQWFERNRFEMHPENGRPYDVLLGRLGNDRLLQQGRNWFSFPKANPGQPHYYAPTGHAIAEIFWGYWSNHGLDLGDSGVSERESLALWGMPLSEPAFETNGSGNNVYTQHFERARFEHHPTNAPPYDILLGLLGNEVRATPPPPPPPNPCDNIPNPLNANVSSKCVEIGAQITTLTYGFEPDESVAFWVNGPDGEVYEIPGEKFADEDGELLIFINTSFLYADPNGIWSLVVKSVNSPHTAVVYFKVLPKGGAQPTPTPGPQPTQAPNPTATPAPPPPSFNGCQNDPNAGQAPNHPVDIVTVNKSSETVTLKNTSTATVSLSGWRMCSILANQEHMGISGSLAPGESKDFTHAGGNIWNNSQKDDGALYDPQGRLISYWSDPN